MNMNVERTTKHRTETWTWTWNGLQNTELKHEHERGTDYKTQNWNMNMNVERTTKTQNWNMHAVYRTQSSIKLFVKLKNQNIVRTTSKYVLRHSST